jgi:hypothetical protein
MMHGQKNIKHRATIRKVPGTIPCVAGIFPVESDSSVYPGADSASKKVSTRIFLGVKAAGA